MVVLMIEVPRYWHFLVMSGLFIVDCLCKVKETTGLTLMYLAYLLWVCIDC